MSSFQHRNPREKEIIARHYLLHLDEIPVIWRQKDWIKLGALVEYTKRGIPLEMSKSDPCMYRCLCAALCEYNIRGYDGFNLERLRRLADEALISQSSISEVAETSEASSTRR